MEGNCSSCKEIVEFELSLDKRANDLVSKVNSLCADVRARNKKKWENFEYWVNLPVIGELLYDSFRAPRGLESEPDYAHSDFYKSEVSSISEQARLLEQMKENHLDHFGDEKVEAEFGWDYAGYYEGNHPANPMSRRDAYKTYVVDGKEDKLVVFLPKKFDFVSAAGVGTDKMQEGAFVLESGSRKVVPMNNCNWSWTAFQSIFARTGLTYSLKELL